jgi:PAS domain S-box-containing protein
VLAIGLPPSVKLDGFDWVVATASEARTALTADASIDLVLIDLELLSVPGSSFVAELRALAASTPLVMLTHEAGEPMALAALERGAADYLVKRDHYLRQLPHVLKLALERSRLERRNGALSAELAALTSDAASHQPVELELRQCQARFAALLEHSIQAIALFVDDRITYVSRSFCELVGRTEAELLGLPLSRQLDWIHPEDRNQALDRRRRRLQGEPIEETSELRFLRPNGEIRWGLHMAKAITLSGKPAGLSMVIDVTEQKRAEAALTLSEQKARAIFDQTFEMIGLLDTSGNVLDANLTALRFAGVDLDSVKGKPFWETPWWAHSEPLQEQLRQAIRAASRGAFARFETTHQAGDGSLHIVDFSLKPVHDEQGQVRWLVPEGRNITLTRQLEQAQRESEERLRFALEASEIGAWTLNMSDGQATRTPLHDRIFGYETPPPSWSRECFLAHVVAEDREHVERCIAEASAQKRAWHFECRIRRVDGQIRWIWAAGGQRRDTGQTSGVVQDITERRQAQEELRNAETRNRLATAATGVGIWERELASDRLHWDAKMFDIYGVTPTEDGTVEHAAFREQVFSEDLPRLQQGVESALRGPEPVTMQFRIRRRADGAVRHIQATLTARRDHPGTTWSLVGTNLDITERVEAERLLLERNHLLSETQRLAQMGSWSWDPQKNTLTWSERLYDIFDVSPDSFELTFGSFLSLVHSEDRAAWEAWMLRVRAGEKTELLEFRTTAWPGTVHHVRARAELRPGVDGAPDVVIGTIKDITAARRAEERFRLAVEASPSAMLMVDAAGLLILANSQAEALFGYSRAELLGRSIEQLVPTEARAAHAGLRVAFSAAPSQRAMGEAREIFGLRRNGTHVPIEIRLTPVQGVGGGVVLASITDLTLKKQQERAREMLEAQLRQAQKMEALGTLAGGIAHDFNNLLTAIVANLHVAESELPKDHPARSSLEQIATASGRASDLVDRILSFSRRKPREPRALEVRPALAEATGLLNASLPGHVTLSIHCGDELPPVVADPIEFQQVVLNLGTNAWHALEGRPGEVRIALDRQLIDATSGTVLPELRSGSYVRLVVADTGCGMDEATLQRVFEPFFTTRDVGAGTGLGLSIIHGIVKSLGGAIHIDSERGRGTEVAVYFPEAGPSPPTREARASAEVLALGHGEQLLLVEDEASVLIPTRRLLERQGYSITACAGAAAALAELRANPQRYRLMLTDQNMPRVSGIELIKQARQLLPDLRVILASGAFVPALEAEAQLLGRVELLAKPFKPPFLFDMVRRLLAER